MKNIHLILGMILILFFLVSCKNSDSKYKEAVGKEYRTLTDLESYKGFEELGGSMIESLNNIDYGFSHLKKDSIDLIAFEKILKQKTGKAKYLLIDILEIKGLKKNQYICYGQCRLNEKLDSEIIAVYDYEEDVEYYKNVVIAWRANRKNGHIESIDLRGIDCINEGYGVE